METSLIPRLDYSQFDMIIYVSVIFTFCPYYSIYAIVWWMFCHDRIAFLRKDEIFKLFTNSCSYRVLIVVGWVCQNKVPSSIITNGVNVGHSQA
jgi:hypothetical protein